MNLILIKDKLRDGLQAVYRASDNHQNLPILKNVLIASGDNQIKLSATNLEIAVSYKVAGKVLEPGSITVPVETLLNLINNLQSERLSLETKSSILEIKTDNYQAKIQGLPPEDFPLIPQISNIEESISLDGGVLKEALTQVSIATQFSELRPELNSVAMTFNLESLVFAATDSFRLAEKTLQNHEFKTSLSRDVFCLIPLKSVQELLRVLKDGEEVTIHLDQNQILFKAEQFEFISRLLQGSFPDYKKVIPEKYGAEAVLKKEELAGALKLTGILSPKISEVKIKFLENKKAMEIFSVEESVGENSYVLSAKISGKTGEVGFNWRYLLDGLKAIPREEVLFGVNDDNHPSILKSAADPSYFYILMPILKS
jgi:DNA polymerase-3 subunit beta